MKKDKNDIFVFGLLSTILVVAAIMIYYISDIFIVGYGAFASAAVAVAQRICLLMLLAGFSFGVASLIISRIKYNSVQFLSSKDNIGKILAIVGIAASVLFVVILLVIVSIGISHWNL